MINLFKTNIYRTKKDILLYICLFISLLMVLFNSIGGKFVSNMAGMEEFATLYNGKHMFSTSFSPSNNMGVLIPIFVYIIMNREYTHGTIRNKVIYGYSKTQIYFSSYLTTLLCGFAFLLFTMLCNLGLGTLILGYGTAFNLAEFSYILKVLVLGMFVYSVFLTISHFIMHLFKSLGYIAYIITLFAILGVSATSMIPSDNPVLKFITNINPAIQLNYISSANFETKLIVTMIITTLVYLVTLNLIGLKLFQKTDLK